jgi:hypothetical protein
VETEAARRSRTDPPPRPAPPAPPPSARPDLPAPPPPLETVEMRPAPPQIRVSSPAASAGEPGHSGDGNGDVGVGPVPEVPPPEERFSPPPERSRWAPGAGSSISDRGLKGFRDVVADGATLAAATAQAGSAPAPPTEPPPATEFESVEPRTEAPPERRRPLPREPERTLRPPAPDQFLGREARDPRRSPEPPRPSSRRLEPPPAPPFFGAPGGEGDAAGPGPDINEPELRLEPASRPPSSMVRQEDLRPRPPGVPRAPQPDSRRERRPDTRAEKPPEPRTEKRDSKRPDRWAEKPPSRKRGRLAGLPVRKIAVGSLAALLLLAGVAIGLWNRSTIVGYFRGSPNLTRPADSRDVGAKSKIADRIGGSTNPGADDGAPVAQKVVLYEEDPADPAGKRYVGSAVWHVESVPPAPGKPNDLAIRADIEIPEQKISARWSLRRNDDKALPASHTVEVNFTLPPNFPHKGITNIPGVLMKQSESTRGVPLAGLAVKVTNNFFLIGLSSQDADRTRNIQLLKERGWFDIPLVYEDGRRAIIAIEKGTPGERAFTRAFDAWGQ